MTGDILRLEGDASVPGELALAVQGETLTGCRPPEGREEQYFHEVFALVHYLTLRAAGSARLAAVGNAPPGVNGAEIAAIAASAEDEQVAWLRARLEAVREPGRCAS